MKAKLAIPSPDRKSIETILNEFGRIGGPTEFGWHTIEPMFRCWAEYGFSRESDGKRSDTQGFALAVGTLVHEFLALFYRQFIANSTFAPGEARPATVDTLYNHLLANDYADEANEAVRLFDAHQAYYRGQDSYLAAGTKIVAVEHLIETKLPWGDPYTARADLVIETPEGFWVVDHKTTAARTTEFIEGWQVEPAILGLAWAAGDVWQPLRGVSINGIVKTKSPGFDRNMYAIELDMIEDWLGMVKAKKDEEPRAREAGWPVNFTQCFRKMGPYVGKCRYFELCIYGVDE